MIRRAIGQGRPDRSFSCFDIRLPIRRTRNKNLQASRQAGIHGVLTLGGANGTMGRISINNVKAGMVLAKDALNFRKQTLLPAGTALTEKNIETMIAWGVSEVNTEGCSEPSLEQVEQRIGEDPKLAGANAELDHRFADVRNDPIMKEILAIAKKQLLGGQA